jgi:hypothetical protein
LVTGTGGNPVDSWWYYLDNTGKVVTGWLYDQGNWYYLYPEGSMAKGWIQVNGEWYYLNSSGEMQKGWIKDNGYSYYLKDDGAMAHDSTIDGYQLNASGEWALNESNNSQVTSDTDLNDDGVKYVTVDGVEYPDYTEAINDMLQRNEEECFEHRNDIDKGLRWFINKVNY